MIECIFWVTFKSDEYEFSAEKFKSRTVFTLLPQTQADMTVTNKLIQMELIRLFLLTRIRILFVLRGITVGGLSAVHCPSILMSRQWVKISLNLKSKCTRNSKQSAFLKR